MVPSKLKRHLETKHPSHVGTNLAYFKRARDLNQRQQDCLLDSVKVSEKAMEASYMLVELIAKQKKPHIIAETLILPTCKKIAGVMLGPDAAHELSKVPSSDNTIKRRMDNMSEDIEQHLTEKLQASGRFSLQIDESTDISGAAQLLANVRYVDGDSIKETFFFCKEMESHTTGEEIFRVTNDYLKENNLTWNMCLSLCTDDKIRGFMGKLILWREALEQGSMDMFPLASAAPQAARERAVYAEHLKTLKERFECYFPRVANIEDYDWIRDPFNQESSTEKLTMKEREECAELRVDRTLKLKFSELPLDQFWLASASEYPNISHHAIEQLLLFPTTYLCELAFSTLVYMKNNRRSRLSVEQDLRVALSSVPPRIKKICAPRQAHVSH
ncbi:hypothetical protein ABVT39_017197 [Epinephelus coioides]